MGLPMGPGACPCATIHLDELNAEYESAKRRAEAADKESENAAQTSSVARARVDVKKEEIALLKTRSKLARKEGNAARGTDIEKLLPREESGLKVFKAMQDAAEAQKDRTAAAADFARARMRMLDAERDLSRMHDARLTETATPGDAAALAELHELDAKILESSRSLLAALREYAKMSKRLAESTSAIAKARLELLDAWESYKKL